MRKLRARMLFPKSNFLRAAVKVLEGLQTVSTRCQCLETFHQPSLREGGRTPFLCAWWWPCRAVGKPPCYKGVQRHATCQCVLLASALPRCQRTFIGQRIAKACKLTGNADAVAVLFADVVIG